MKQTKNKSKISNLYYSDLELEINIVTIIFLVTLLLGIAQSANPPQFVVDALQSLYELAQDVVLGNRDLFSVILINNIVAVITIIIGGLLLGISPVLSSIINGYLIGVIGGELINSGQADIFIVGLIPHGIIEIPALILSLSVGLRLGKQVWKILLNKSQLKVSLKKRLRLHTAILWFELKRSLRFGFQVIIPLIILAAIIESFITPALIQMVI